MDGPSDMDRSMESLREFLSNPIHHGCVVHGERRTGKTTLVKRLAATTRSVYIRMPIGPEESMVACAMEQVRQSFPFEGQPKTLSGLLDVLYEICREAPTLIILDDFHRLSAALVHADSMIMGFMDNYISETDSKIIAVMPTATLGIVRDYDNPLYGRFICEMGVGESMGPYQGVLYTILPRGCRPRTG